MMLKRLLRRDDKGIGAVEFALIAPVLIAFVVGIAQMGKLFFASADMKNAMAHGARAASVLNVPGDAELEAVVKERLARSGGIAKADVDIKRGVESGNNYVDIEMSYQVPLDLIFFDAGPVTLKDTRRVYTQMASTTAAYDPAPGTTSTSTTSASTTSGGTTTSTTSGGTTSTTSGGTTSSTSATSASSTGGSTSATSASSTTSSTTSASSTSSGSNGNGNSNGNSNHNHGNCNKKC